MRCVSGEVGLPESVFWARSRGIEITQRDRLEVIGVSEIREDLFHHRLGAAIGVDGYLGVGLVDGSVRGLAVDGRTRGEGEMIHSGLEHRGQKR